MLKWCKQRSKQGVFLLATGFCTILFPSGTPLDSSPGETLWYGWDVVVRILFAAYYIPVILVCLILLLDSVVHLSFAVLLPVVLDQAPNLEEISAVKGLIYWVALLWLLMPFVTSTMGVVTVGHKILRCVGEAMVDSYSVFNSMNYSLVLGMLTFTIESVNRIIVFTIISSVLAFTLLYTQVTVLWSSRDSEVRVAMWTIVVAQVLGSTVSLFRRSREQPVMRGRHGLLAFRALLIDWWRDNMGRVRHSAMNMLLVMSGVIVVLRGPIKALQFFVETLTFLNIPNIVGFTSLALTLWVVRAWQRVAWLRRHPRYRITFGLLLAPYGSMWIYTVFYFECSPGIMVLAALILGVLFVGCVEKCQHFDVGPRGTVFWASFAPGERITPLPVHLAAELEDSFQRGTKHPALVSLEYKYSMDTMTLHSRIDNSTAQLRRTVRHDTAVSSLSMASELLPRVLLLQSRYAFAGSRFNRTRIVLRIVVIVAISVIYCIVGGVVLQETVLPLQPIAVVAKRSTLVDSASGIVDTLSIDHLVLDIHLSFKNSNHPAYRTTPLPWSVADAFDTDPLGSLCTKRYRQASLFELALLSLAPYVDSQDSLHTVVDGINAATSGDWEIRYPGPTDPGLRRRAREPWKSFVEVHSLSKNITVVSIRGTDFTSLFDMLQDVSIYLEAFLYQLMTHLIPAASLVPSVIVADAIEFAAAVEAITLPWHRREALDGWGSRHFYDIVIRYLKQRHGDQRYSATNTILAGHSLGGAIAHIVGARLGMRSFGFHSPGVLLPRKKLGITTGSLNRFATTVIAAPDIVPYIGWQTGEIFHLDCTDRVRERCHALETTVEAMWYGCPSLRAVFPNLHHIWVE